MAMMQEMIFLEANKRNKHGRYSENAKCPIFPPCLEQDAVRAIVHKRHNAHLHVAHGKIAEPSDDPVGGVPGNRSEANPHSVK